jgi:hypothetical protein
MEVEALEAGITPEQAAAWRADGVVLVKNALPKEEVLAWRDAWRALKADIAAGTASAKRVTRFVGGDLGPVLDEAWRHPALVAIAKALIGPDVALYLRRILVKDELWNGDVATHQDMPYFHGVLEKLAVFVPLEPYTRASGNLSFVAGSNQFGNLGVRGTIDHAAHPELPIVSPEAEPGDILLTDFLVWHFSKAATEPLERPMLQFAYQTAACGSYSTEPGRPTLVCGEWRTDRFARHGDWVTLDTLPPR